jgi:hypothetical protein
MLSQFRSQSQQESFDVFLQPKAKKTTTSRKTTNTEKLLHSRRPKDQQRTKETKSRVP